MPKGVHTSKRKSGCKQRQEKKAKLESIQKIAGSFNKYLLKPETIDNSQTLSKVTENQYSANLKDVSSICSTSTSFEIKPEVGQMVFPKNSEVTDTDKSNNGNLNREIDLQIGENMEDVEMLLSEKDEATNAEIDENSANDDDINNPTKLHMREKDDEMIFSEKNESIDAENEKNDNPDKPINPDIFSDISHWNIPISSNILVDIVKKGSLHFQNKEGPFSSTIKRGENPKGKARNLSKEWFYKEMPNNEKILRSWMIYSPVTNNLYCFCCRLFACTRATSAFVHGFWKWWKLNPKVFEHEASNEHFQNLEKWKTLEIRLRLNSTIDHTSQQQMNTEKKKWKDLLTRLLDITLFLAKQNLAFRGHDECSTSSNRGNFLELVNLLSKYDAVLKEHLLNLEQCSSQKISYLSPDIQNEFISVLSNHVKSKLVEEIKSATYFGMMFDSTPDIDHTDQMSQVIRYVKIDDRKVEIKEVFLGFFPLEGKKATDLSEEILKKIDKDGLDIMRCRSQGYDNAANMSGIHGGVQAIIKSRNRKAVFFGCINHSLNLCGQHSFAQNASCVRFFGTLQAVYAFFSTSTNRWEALMKHSEITVKRVATTRWSAHHASVKVMAEKFDEVTKAIEELCDPKENLDTKGAAQNLLPAVHNFTFLCYLFFWNDVLKEVNYTQVSLQAKALSLDESLIKLETLRLYIFEKRNEIVEKAIEKALKKSTENEIPIERRIRRKKKMAGEQLKDEALSLQEENKKDMLECLDRFHSEIQARSTAIRDTAGRFEVLENNNLLLARDEQLKILVSKLTSFYDEVCEQEICLEIPRLRRHLKAANLDSSKTKDWVALDFLKFIVEWDFIESLPNLVLSLKLFLTICVSVASCERSFSKMKLIKNYLRSTMSDSRLSSLAILTIEHEATQNIDFDEVISSFASMKARRVKF